MKRLTCFLCLLFSPVIFGNSNSFMTLEQARHEIINFNSSFNDINLDGTCFCKAGCFFGTGDGYHFKKTVDVDCNLSLIEKKETVVDEIMSHYIEAHGINNLPVILDKVAIRCFNVN